MENINIGEVFLISTSFIYEKTQEKYMVITAKFDFPYELQDTIANFYIPLDLYAGLGVHSCLAYIYRPENIQYPNVFHVAAEREEELSKHGCSGYIVSDIFFTGFA